MRHTVIAYVAAAAAFLALDAVWLSTMASRLYRPAIGHLMGQDFALPPAVLFYVLYVAGIVVFAVLPAERIGGAAWRGAFLGLLAYATYDLTNQATLRGWPWTVTLADLAWGTFVTGVAATVAWWAAERFGR